MLTRLLDELALTGFQHLGTALNLLLWGRKLACQRCSSICIFNQYTSIYLIPSATVSEPTVIYMPWIALMSVSQRATRSQNECKFERLFSKVKNCRLLGGTAPGKLVAALLISDSWETSFRVSVRDASAVCMKLFTCKLRSATWTDASRSSLAGQPGPLPACSTRRKFSWLRSLLKPELHFGHDTYRELMQNVCCEMMWIFVLNHPDPTIQFTLE